MQLEDALAKLGPLQKFVRRSALVGSRVTCNPPPPDTDQDVLVLVNDGGEFSSRTKEVDGLTRAGSFNLPKRERKQRAPFISVKSGEIDFIVTDDAEFFDRFLAASAVCKRLNLLDKEDRVAVFHAVLFADVCGTKE